MSKKDSGSAKAPEPMDSSVREQAVGEPQETNFRTCYAAQTLLAEVKALFPETDTNVGFPNGRNVYLAVFFDLTDASAAVQNLFLLIENDARVERVEFDDSQVCGVFFHNSSRTQDLRDSFGLADAWLVLTEVEEWVGSTIIEDGSW